MCRLHVQPQLRRRTQNVSQIEGGLGGDASFAAYQLIQARSAPADLLGERRLGYSHGIEKFLSQHFTGMKGIIRLVIHCFCPL